MIVGGYGERRFEAGVSLPISDNSALRLSVMSNVMDGYRRNVFLDKEVAGYDTIAVRSTLIWEPA